MFVRQPVQSIDIERDSATLQTDKGPVSVELSSTAISSSRSLFLNTLALDTERGAFTFRGLPGSAIADVERAVANALRRQELTACLTQEAEKAGGVLQAWSNLLDRDAYVTGGDIERWRAYASQLTQLGDADADLFERLPDGEQQIRRRVDALRSAPRETVDKRNKSYARHLLQAHSGYFDTVERSPLTGEQREAIVFDEENALVVAGAGTGKTSTIVGKVGFILQMGWARPDEILLLAFTEKAAEEMRERIAQRLGVDIKVRTFHAMGLEIVGQTSGKKPSVCKEATDPAAKASLIEELIGTSVKDQAFRSALISFHGSPRRPWKPEWQFKSLAEYNQYLDEVELRTLKGDLVKSYEECEIANFLYSNGIKYEYERRYEIDVATPERRQYQPDFYLTDYKIYIEHWGVDRNGRAAPFMNPNEYDRKMKWARNLHEEQKTKLVETYSWERQFDVLLTELETKLRAHGVEMRPLPAAKVLEVLNKAGYINPFARLIATFIGLYKSARRTMADLAQRAKGEFASRMEAFLRIFEKLLNSYNNTIHGRGEIDFEDMITMATDHVRSAAYRSRFRYIIVDEFQDISHGRAELIGALRQQVEGARIFAVGDDWQSIYRFNSSDISLMTSFEDFFGFTRKTTLSKTFRFNNQIADFSSRFVQRNPKQLRKKLTTATTSDAPGIVMCTRDAEDPIDDILNEIRQIGSNASVFLLARYRHTLPKDIADIKRKFPTLKIDAMTVHASKGLEADYVILLGLSKGKYGFPSEIADDPVLSLVLPDSEAYEFAEERRLFYVALTRAKKRVFVMVEADNPSYFAGEIMADNKYFKEVRETTGTGAERCPACGRGRLVQRKSKFGAFHGCSKYPVCTFTRDAGATSPR